MKTCHPYPYVNSCRDHVRKWTSSPSRSGGSKVLCRLLRGRREKPGDETNWLSRSRIRYIALVGGDIRSSTAAHTSWPFAHTPRKARNGNDGNARNGNERMELEMVLAMSRAYLMEMVSRGKGGERLGLSICVGRLDIIACLCTRY